MMACVSGRRAPRPAAPSQPRQPDVARAMDRPTRTRARSTLPDARVHRVVEGLLSTPPEPVHPDRGKPRDQPGDPLAALIPRVDWTAELAAEERRRSRYGRPVSVLVVDVGEGREPEPLMRLTAGILRRESRASDRVTRVGPGRFQVMLPETRETGATAYAERLRRTWTSSTPEAGTTAPARLTIVVATTGHAETLPQALERAIRQLA